MKYLAMRTQRPFAPLRLIVNGVSAIGLLMLAVLLLSLIVPQLQWWIQRALFF